MIHAIFSPPSLSNLFYTLFNHFSFFGWISSFLLPLNLELSKSKLCINFLVKHLIILYLWSFRNIRIIKYIIMNSLLLFNRDAWWVRLSRFKVHSFRNSKQNNLKQFCKEVQIEVVVYAYSMASLVIISKRMPYLIWRFFNYF